MDGNPFLQNHPMVAQRGWEETVVPLSIHGDGVTVTGAGRSWNKSVDVLSWASLLASGATLSVFHFVFYLLIRYLVKWTGSIILPFFIET